MINTQLEHIVQLVMVAYIDVHGQECGLTPMFELELRKTLMQTYCNTQLNMSPPTHTYATNSGQVLPTKQILNG